MAGEDRSQKKHVEGCLVVSDEDCWPRFQMLLARDDCEAHAGGQGHGVFKRSARGPLCDSVLADKTKGYGGKNTVEGAYDEAAIGSEEAGIKGGLGDTKERHAIEGGCEAEIDTKELEEAEEDNVHGA